MTVADSQKTSKTQTRPDFEIKPGKLFIDGEFRDGVSGEKVDVIDPTTESVVTPGS